MQLGLFFFFTSFSMSDIILPPILSGSPGLSYLKAGSGKKQKGRLKEQSSFLPVCTPINRDKIYYFGFHHSHCLFKAKIMNLTDLAHSTTSVRGCLATTGHWWEGDVRAGCRKKELSLTLQMLNVIQLLSSFLSCYQMVSSAPELRFHYSVLYPSSQWSDQTKERERERLFTELRECYGYKWQWPVWIL